MIGVLVRRINKYYEAMESDKLAREMFNYFCLIIFQLEHFDDYLLIDDLL